MAHGNTDMISLMGRPQARAGMWQGHGCRGGHGMHLKTRQSGAATAAGTFVRVPGRECSESLALACGNRRACQPASE